MQTQEDQFPITGKEGAPIELEKAAQWTKNYRQMRPGERKAHLFGHEVFRKLLAQQGCVAIRIYYANSLSLNAWQRFIVGISNFLRKKVAHAEGEEHLILVGVTREGKDQTSDREPVSDTSKPLSDAGEPVSDQGAEKPVAEDLPDTQAYQIRSAASRAEYDQYEQSWPDDGDEDKAGNDTESRLR